MPHFEAIPTSDWEWYQRAKAKIDSFLHNLDPTLSVEVTLVEVVDARTSRPYDTLSLRFISHTRPSLNWTMEIEKDPRYVEEDLERVVREIYSERIASLE